MNEHGIMHEDEFNPYHQWLGLSPSASEPHHFQLLGVRPGLSDESEIQRSVESGFQRNLDRLSRIPPGLRPAEQKAVRQRLELARETLLDPEKRGRYLHRLQSKAKAKSAADTPPPSGPARPDPPKSTPRSESNASRKAPPRPASTDEIPMAKPVARPAATPTGDSARVSGDTSGVPVSIVTDRPLKRKTSRVMFEWVIKLVMMLAMIAGLILLYNNFGTIVALLRSGDVALPTRGPVAATDDRPPPDATGGSGPGLNPDPSGGDARQDATGDRGDNMNGPEGDPGTDDSPSGLPEGTTSSRPEDKPVDAPEGGPGDAAVADGGEPEETNDGDPPSVQPPKLRLDDRQLDHFGMLLALADRSLRWNRLDDAQSWLQQATAIAGPDAAEPARWESDQRMLGNRLAVMQSMRAQLSEFWGQVKRSCLQMPGNQVIEPGDQVLGFVEAVPEGVILRNAGSNIRYDYSFLPPGLAVALVEAGDIENNARWARQEAACYAIERDQPEQYRERIDELLQVAEAGGESIASIQSYLDFQFRPIVDSRPETTATKLPRPTELWRSIRQELGYDDPNRVSRDQAATLLDPLWRRASLARPEQCLRLEDILILSVRAGDANGFVHAICELDRLVEQDTRARMADGFHDLATTARTAAQRRELLERAIDWLFEEQQRWMDDASGAGTRLTPGKLERLRVRLLKIADEHLDAVRRLEQLQPEPR